MPEIVHRAHKTRVSTDVVTCAACIWYVAGDDEDLLREWGLAHEVANRGRTEPWEVFEPGHA